MSESGAIYVGLMSGTSADGIDAALVRIRDQEGALFDLIGFETVTFPEALRREILEVADRQTGTVDRVCRLDAVLGEWFAKATNKLLAASGVSPEAVVAIGSHGQTLHHLPEEPESFGVGARGTLQVGNPSVIAERTGICTVSDFRTRDIAVGGQGAPLVPLLDYLVFRSETEGRVLLNIGGISNVTVLPPGCGPDDLVAFDTGPGNVIVDLLTMRHTDGRHRFDEDGGIAGKATVRQDILKSWLSNPYFEQAPPKSTGREVFGTDFVDDILQTFTDVPVPDLIATATAFTALSIADGLRCYAPDFDRIRELLVSGGGSQNPVMMREIQAQLPGINVGITDDLGISAEAKEAIAFAVLAHRSLNKLPGNLPAATGASKAVVLGQVTPGGEIQG